MPKNSTFPTLFDECKTINISKLKEWGYLHEWQYNSFTITWSRNGEQIGAIDCKICNNNESNYIELNYKASEKPINYKVQLVTVPSNLGRGVVWYFLCPNTGKRCRKLYLVGGVFLHREAFRGCMYDKQTQSHKNRVTTRLMGKVFGSDKASEILHSKYFKVYYAGKPTKRYLRILKQMQECVQFTDEAIQAIYHTGSQ